MITGQNKNQSERAYREIFMDSSSSLKIFSQDRKLYYRKFILSEEVQEKDSAASLMGKIVEVLLLQPELFDKKFSMSAIASPPTSMMLDFVESLYDYTIAATSEEGDLTRSFEDISRDAYVKAGWKITYEAVIKKFTGSDAEIYYNEILNVRTNHMDVVTPRDVTNAENIVEELKNNPVTKKIVNLVDSKRYSVLNQFQIEGYNIDDHLFKSMIDKLIVDHTERLITIFDLKCVWNVEGFLSDYYLYRRGYFQAYLYYKAVLTLTNDVNHEYYGYNVEFPKFIVCDSTNYFNPLIYVLDQQDIDDAYKGFEYKGRYYPGFQETLEDLKWSLETNMWNISRKNYLSDGIVKLTE